MDNTKQTQRRGLFASSRSLAARRASNSLVGTLGAALVLVLGVVLLTGISLDRSQSTIVRFLGEKGIALISALESGVRSGARSRTGVRFQYLVEELAERPDVSFIAVTMPDGTILAHSNPRRLGEVLASSNGREFTAEALDSLHPTESPAWSIVDMEGSLAFVVYKVFQPRIRDHKPVPPSGGAPYIFVGLDLGPMEMAQARDRERALLIGGGVLLAGMLALLALHALERLQASRRGQRAAEALAEELAVTLPDGLVLLDEKGRVVQLNSAALHLLDLDPARAPSLLPDHRPGPVSEPASEPAFGVASGSASGSVSGPASEREPGEEEGQRKGAGGQGPRKLGDVLPAALAELAKRLLRDGVLPDTEVIVPLSGQVRHLSVRGGHVNDVDKERLGSVMFLRDMTDVRRLEAEVRRREKLAAVGNLAAGVAHELRNPLSSIKGYATYFGGRFPEGSSDREAAEIMVKEVDRLNRAISDLIGLSRPTDVRPQPTDMTRLLGDTLRLIEQDAAARGVRVGLNTADDVPPLPLDPDRMRQVLLNLCLNALEAMPDGGELDLSLTMDADGGKALLEVRDTGTGIAPDALPHIFDPYYTTKGQGTGLGLATVHKIVEAHGGSITVSTVPGAGTVFHVFMPLYSGPRQGEI